MRRSRLNSHLYVFLHGIYNIIYWIIVIEDALKLQQDQVIADGVAAVRRLSLRRPRQNIKYLL
jgi:hypothetical protein